MTAPQVTIKIAGVGAGHEVTVEAGTTLDEALNGAGVNPESQGLGVQLNGENVSGDTPVQNGDRVVATASEVKLGS